MVNFSQIPDKLKYPARLKATLSTIHSDVVTYVSSNFRRNIRYRTKVLGVMNTLTYIVLSGDAMPAAWSKDNPLEHLDILEDGVLKDYLGELYLYDKNINWDIAETDSEPAVPAVVTSTSAPAKHLETKSATSTVISPTPKEDLYIKPPTVPQLDFTRPWRQCNVNGDIYLIYPSLPEIPSRQSEISVTTDVDTMTYADIMRLFPNQTIHTRSSAMYVPVSGMDYDEILGNIIPVSGFTTEQVRDNIIKYPHFFKLTRIVNGEMVSFYSHIEIDGKLHKTMDVWKDLPDSAKIPRNADFIKEYVVRRYLLERDINGVEHKYPMFGKLDPFLTLFTTPDNYIQLGYKNSENIGRRCVISRVAYKQSRNPILRRCTHA